MVEAAVGFEEGAKVASLFGGHGVIDGRRHAGEVGRTADFADRQADRRRFEQERVGKLLEEQRDLLLVQNAALRTQLGEEATDERPTDAGRPGAAGPGDGP
jgi:hypothetical protein